MIYSMTEQAHAPLAVSFSSWLKVTALGSKGQNIKMSHGSMMSYHSIFASLEADARGSRK